MIEAIILYLYTLCLQRYNEKTEQPKFLCLNSDKADYELTL